MKSLFVFTFMLGCILLQAGMAFPSNPHRIQTDLTRDDLNRQVESLNTELKEIQKDLLKIRIQHVSLLWHKAIFRARNNKMILREIKKEYDSLPKQERVAMIRALKTLAFKDKPLKSILSHPKYSAQCKLFEELTSTKIKKSSMITVPKGVLACIHIFVIIAGCNLVYNYLTNRSEKPTTISTENTNRMHSAGIST